MRRTAITLAKAVRTTGSAEAAAQTSAEAGAAAQISAEAPAAHTSEEAGAADKAADNPLMPYMALMTQRQSEARQALSKGV